MPAPGRLGNIGPTRPGGAIAWTAMEDRMDQLVKDARRLAAVGTFFITAGWIFVIYALVAGVIWWIDLAQRESFNVFEALAVSAAAVGVPSFVSCVVAGFGYALRLFALYVVAKTQ
jgi:hypothetical protein